MSKLPRNLKIPLLTLALLITSSFSLSFDLDPLKTEMCFYLKGSDTGKTFKLNYQIIGLNPENVKFLFKDHTDGELIVSKENSPLDGKLDLNMSVNYLHEFQLCWKNKDSEKKQVNFYYIQDTYKSVIDSG